MSSCPSMFISPVTTFMFIKFNWRWVSNVNLKKNVGQKMEDESSFLHKQLGMHVSSSAKTGNNPYTYNCGELYMASPLEKSRELAVLIVSHSRHSLAALLGSPVQSNSAIHSSSNCWALLKQTILLYAVGSQVQWNTQEENAFDSSGVHSKVASERRLWCFMAPAG